MVWKIIRNIQGEEIVWRNKEKDINVGVYKDVGFGAGRKTFDVEIDRAVGDTKLIASKKTRLEGIKIAQRWMRSHPNG